jgi:hypothetical protein
MTEGRGERATGTPDITIHDPEDAIGIVSGGGSGERAKGIPNTIYDLSSVLFHSLEGGASYDTYIQDAEREGDEELTEFFRQVRKEDRDRAAEARMLLAERTTAASPAEGAASGASSRPEPSTELPNMEAVPEGAPSGDVRGDYIVDQMTDEDLTPPEETIPPDVLSPSDAPKTESVPPRTVEGASPPTAAGTEERDLPRTEPVGGRMGQSRRGPIGGETSWGRSR